MHGVIFSVFGYLLIICMKSKIKNEYLKNYL